MIVKIYNRFCGDLIKFRLNLLNEWCIDENWLNYEGSYSQLIEHNKILNGKAEDIYKISNSKWKKLELDFFYCHYDKNSNEITNISGVKNHNEWIRIGINHFALKKYSKIYPSIFFKPQGPFEESYNFVKKYNMKGLFLTVYKHNKKLQALSKVYKGRGVSTPAKIDYIRMLKFAGEYKWNNVMQDFFVVEYKEKFNILSII
tara:strand:- start:310 stop:915 length:606 start_codon:yes stop_codon:yes gene_type:complete